MKMIFVDDVRMTPERFDLAFKTMEEFLVYVENNPTEELFISLDHDMGPNVIDGNEMINRLVNMENNIKHVQVHSSNGPASLNMLSKFKSGRRVGCFPADMIIDENMVDVVNGIESRRPYKIN